MSDHVPVSRPNPILELLFGGNMLEGTFKAVIWVALLARCWRGPRSAESSHCLAAPAALLACAQALKAWRRLRSVAWRCSFAVASPISSSCRRNPTSIIDNA